MRKEDRKRGGERRQGKEKRKRKGRGDMEARKGIKGRREGRRDRGEEGKWGGEGRDDQSFYCFCHLFLVTLHELVPASHILLVCRKKSREGCCL